MGPSIVYHSSNASLEWGKMRLLGFLLSRTITTCTIGQLGESLEGHFTTESILLHQEPSIMEVGMRVDRVKEPNHKLQEKPENLHSCNSAITSTHINVITPAVADEG
ncbi:hypothetical protein RRG08_000689 [Elysia crispata]|uniref:Uncharacterized protein n=1 Tax=Elysia crispata TaxID=231223 RepID=A0AAE1E4A2_9GAST|nr:hypothetical protein RRG08_000689 [Elysia crispata]